MIPSDTHLPLPATPKRRSGRRGFAIFVFVVSVLAVLAEAVWGLCASAIFDPIPNTSTLLLYCFTVGMLLFNEKVLASNTGGILGRSLSPVQRLALCIAGTVVGLFVAVSAAFMFLPISPFLVLLTLFGIGLLGLSPYLVIIALSVQLVVLLRALRETEARPATGRRIIIGTSLLTATVFAWLIGRPLVAAHYVRLALKSPGTPQEQSALRVLRFLRDESSLLDIAYHNSPSYWVTFGFKGAENSWLPYAGYEGTVSNDEVKAARRAYFLLTGKPFEQAPRPQSARRRSPLDMRNDEVAIEETGGMMVGRLAPGLSLADSRLTGTINATSETAVVSWTLRFQNDSDTPQEARADLALPQGATVHQASLWINGKERQAAFGAPDQVRAAYQEVAVVQRRDPLLVTMPAPRHVLAQCFPVPAHGSMQIRLGITTPLFWSRRPDGTSQLRFDPPAFGTINFALPDSLSHYVSLNGPETISTVWHADTVFAPPSVPVLSPRSAPHQWDHLTPGVVRIADTTAPYTKREGTDILFVLDASAGVNGRLRGAEREAFWDALHKLGPHTRVRFVTTADYLTRDTGWRKLPGELRASDIPWDRDFVGGTDPAPALAWALGKLERPGVVVWLHGASPFGISDLSGIRRFDSPRIIGVQLTPSAPDGVMSELAGYPGVQAQRTPPDDPEALWRTVYEIPRTMCWPMRSGETAASNPYLNQIIFTNWKIDVKDATWRRLAAHSATMNAWYEANRLPTQEAVPLRIRAGKVAAAEHLVTPLSSAVVLETREQYERHGLKDENAPKKKASKDKKSSLPFSAPEPSTLLFVGIGAMIPLLHRMRRR